MKAADIVQQMAGRLPALTSEFTTNVGVSTKVALGTAVLVGTTTPHGLSVGDKIYVDGFEWAIPIDTFTRDGTVGTLVTTMDHDLTLPIAETVATAGATESKFNGTFTTINIENRRTVTVVMTDDGDDTATGSPRLRNASAATQTFNGLFEVTAVGNDTTFTYALPEAPSVQPTGDNLTICTKPRVASAVSIEQVQRGYTKKAADVGWLWVILDDVTATQDPRSIDESVSTAGRGTDYQQRVLQPFTVLLALPSTTLVSGGDIRDVAEELFQPICQSLLWKSLDSQLDYAAAEYPIHFIQHGFSAYDGAVYWHAYQFAQVVNITVEDTTGPDVDRAFRDLSLEIAPNLGGTGTIDADIDLDDTPL